MVVDKKQNKTKTIFGKNRGILKPSWAFALIVFVLPAMPKGNNLPFA
jgi:hypothetical protein